MMQRLLAGLALLLLLGCAREAPDELVLWHAYRGAELEALEASVQRFRKATGERVRVVSIPYDAFVNKISVAVPRGNGPDLFISAHDRVGGWAASGLLEPIGFWADEALIDTFFRTTVDPLVYRGDLYGLPLAFKCLALFYDKTLVDAAPRTTDELIAVSKAVRAKDPSTWGLAWELDSLFFHAPWAHGFGASVYADEKDTLAIDSPQMAKSLRFIRRLMIEEKIIPEEATSALISALFKAHKLAFNVSGPWFLGELKGHDQWGIAPLPIVSETGRRASPFLGVEGVMLSAKSKRKERAWALAKFLSGDAEALPRLRDGRQLVANRATYEEASVKADPVAQGFQAQVRHTVSLSNRRHMRRVWVPMKNALSAGIVQGLDAAQALKEARRAIERAGE